MAYDTDRFRADYRAGIHRFYNSGLHAAFVFAWAVAWILFFIRQLDDVSAFEWLTVPLTLVFFNWGEYTVHRRLGHFKTRLGALFYKRHTGDHHSFFVDGHMRYEQARDWRVILFPPWLIVLYSLFLTLPAWWLLSFVNENVAALFAGTLLCGFLMYEIFHSCEHLPDEHALARLPWIRHMRRLHALHHRRDLMQAHNFNISFPLFDWIYGTLYWEPEQKG